MPTRIQNGREGTILDIQVGGAGNTWAVLDVDAAANAFKGGFQGTESIWGRNDSGGSRYLGSRLTNNPDRITGQIMLPETAEKWLRSLRCPFNLRIRYRCGDLRYLNGYNEAINYLDTRVTSKGYNVDLAMDADGKSSDIIQQLDASAGLELREVKLAAQDLSANWIDADVNKVISVGLVQCMGPCGTEATGEEEFWAVTDRDSTPGYSGNPTAMFAYTLDSGVTWTLSYINVAQAADATDVVKVGNKVLVATTKGIAYALIDDIKNGVAKPWTLASGISSNFPKVLAVTNANVVWAAGTGGNIYRSTDGGFSFSSYDAGTLSTQTLNSVAFVNDDLGWFAGNSGVLIKYQAGTLSLVTVRTAISGGTTLSANINAVAVPLDDRGREVYVGAANGQLWRCTATDALYPIFVSLGFLQSGNGSIDDIQFTGFRGQVMFVLQSDSNNTSRVLRDNSGGAMGDNVEVIGDFTVPSNFKYNSFAPANLNFGLMVGQIHSTYGMIACVKKVFG